MRSLQTSLLILGTQLTWAAALQGVDSISTSFSSSSCTAVARMGTLWGSVTLTLRALLTSPAWVTHCQRFQGCLPSSSREQLLCQMEKECTFQAQIYCATSGNPSVFSQVLCLEASPGKTLWG